MSDAVVGTGSVVGFTDGYRNDHLLATTIDRAEQTRDIMQSGRFEAEQLRDAIAASELATEKTGAANQVTMEKIGAATQIAAERLSTNSQLSAERLGAASTLAAYQNFAALQLQASQNHASAMAAAAECCSSTKELIREDGTKTRDLINAIERDRQAVLLADAKNELLLAKIAAAQGTFISSNSVC